MDIPILNLLSAQHGALNGMEQLQCKNFFTIDTTELLQLDEPYIIGAKIINHEDLMLIGVELAALKSVNRSE